MADWTKGYGLHFEPARDLEPGTEIPQLLESTLSDCELTHGLLLGWADDGILWGKVEAGAIEMVPPARPGAARLHHASLEFLRVFAADGEIRVFRSRGSLRIASAREQPDENGARLDGTFALFGAGDGDRQTRNAAGTQVANGRGDTQHLPFTWPEGRRPVLDVRHYFEREATGLWHHVHTRWMGVSFVRDGD